MLDFVSFHPFVDLSFIDMVRPCL